MSFLLVHIFRKSGVRNLSLNCFKIPVSALTQTRKIYLSEQLQQKQEDSSKKAKNANKITLLGTNNSISVVTLEEAKNLSRRRDLELVKVQDLDTKTQRPVYKLLTKAELLSEETQELSAGNSDKKSSSKKAENNLTIGSKIDEHDLSARLKNIPKWLNKGHEVRILIQCASGDIGSGEKIFEKIQAVVKEEESGKIVQKRVKGDHIKFNILPVLKKES